VNDNTMPDLNDIFEVEIERILPGGLGLAHAEGHTIFVTLAARGDVVRVAIDRIRGKVAFANIVEILKPSPERVEPPCPYFGRCGGCDFQQLNYQAQLKAKEEIIRDCLRRLGGIESPPEIAIMPSPDPWHYRARAEWQYDEINQRLGYFERGSHTVCDVAECAVLVPTLEQQLEELRGRIRSGALPEHTRDFQAAAGDDGVSLSPTLVDAVATREVTRTIAGERYHFNAEAFFQTNLALLPALLESAIGNASGDTAVDLYCGVGLFTLPLARRFARVVAVEANGRATSFARRNLEFARRQTAANDNAQLSVDEGSAVQAARSSLGDIRIVTARVGDWFAESSSAIRKADFLLLDPPRTGAENRDIAGILTLRPREISYVSCDPATLARDLKKLIAGGYDLESVAFDMFPQTHHVETVARLTIRKQTQSS
jgi:23S rRNA (uracil1939-C5)-methyltransferase